MYDSIQCVSYTNGMIETSNYPKLTSDEAADELAGQVIVSTEPVTGWGDYDTLVEAEDERGEVRYYLAV